MTPVNQVRIWMAGNMPEIQVFDISSEVDYNRSLLLIRLRIGRSEKIAEISNTPDQSGHATQFTDIKFAVPHNKTIAQCLDEIKDAMGRALKLLEEGK